MDIKLSAAIDSHQIKQYCSLRCNLVIAIKPGPRLDGAVGASILKRLLAGDDSAEARIYLLD